MDDAAAAAAADDDDDHGAKDGVSNEVGALPHRDEILVETVEDDNGDLGMAEGGCPPNATRSSVNAPQAVDGTVGVGALSRTRRGRAQTLLGQEAMRLEVALSETRRT